jgi:transposase InsO family protein
MSRQGNPYNNVLAENFFSILKTECIQAKTKLIPLGKRNQFVA